MANAVVFHRDTLYCERRGLIRHTHACSPLDPLLRLFELALAHSCHGHPLRRGCCELPRSHAWPVVTTSINVVRHDVLASFTPSFHPTRPAAPIHAPHTRTGRATNCCGPTLPSPPLALLTIGENSSRPQFMVWVRHRAERFRRLPHHPFVIV